jgi:hypothetical protein
MSNTNNTTTNDSATTKVIVYAPQIPHGDARTKGYGTTKAVYVLRVHPGFKTLRSRGKYEVIKYLGQCRTDYGMQRGHSASVFARAKAIVAETL